MSWRRVVGYVWVLPVTGGALSLVLLGILTGGRAAIVRGVIEVHGDRETATLDLWLRREDGTTPYRVTFTEPIPPAHLQLKVGRAHHGRVPVTVRADRPGIVRIRATVARRLHGRRIVRRLRVRVLRVGAGRSRRLTLPVRGYHRRRLTVTARFRGVVGPAARRVARRWLGF